MGFFTGAADELQQLLIDQEHRQRQAYLDQITAEDRRSRADDRHMAREIQQENLVASRAQREQQSAVARQTEADKMETSTAPGTEIDDAGMAILNAAGRGSHVTPAALASRAITSKADGSLDTSRPVVEGKRVFKGTAKQQEDVRQRETRASYIKSLPAGPERSFYEAQDAVGDRTPSAYVPKPVKATLHTVKGVGLVRVGDDGVPKVLVPAQNAPSKPGTPQIFKGEDGQLHAVRFTNGQAEEVALPAGLTGKAGVAPAARKTAADIEAEAAARARGTATGKKDAAASGGGGGVLNMLAGIFGAAPATAAPAPGGPRVENAPKTVYRYDMNGNRIQQ